MSLVAVRADCLVGKRALKSVVHWVVQRVAWKDVRKVD